MRLLAELHFDFPCIRHNVWFGFLHEVSGESVLNAFWLMYIQQQIERGIGRAVVDVCLGARKNGLPRRVATGR